MTSSGIFFFNLPAETKYVVAGVVKNRLQRLNCDFQVKKLQKLDPQFASADNVGNYATDPTNNDNFPYWVSFLCEYIESQSECEGLFRKNGSDAKIQTLKESMMDGKGVRMSGIEAAALLKQCLREMKPNLFSNYFTKLLIYIWQTFTKNALRETLILETILLLPCSYLKLCRRIFHCFNTVALNWQKNKMDAKNIAICVSMSLFTLENTQVVTASALNELVHYLIGKHMEIGALTTEIHGLAIKSVEKSTLHEGKKKVTMSEKIRRKAASKVKKLAPDSSSKSESGSKIELCTGSGRRLFFDEGLISPGFNYTTKMFGPVLTDEGSLKLSPSFTSCDLSNQSTKALPNRKAIRRASFSNSEKPELPRSVSSVRKRKHKIDCSASSSLNEEYDDNFYNLSKLNFVTFDSPPEHAQHNTDSEPEDSPCGSRSNTPLILNAATAAKATRHRLEKLNVSKRNQTKDPSKLAKQPDLNQSFMCDSTDECSTRSDAESETNFECAQNSSSASRHVSTETVSKSGAKAKDALTKSFLCSIAEDEVQCNFQFPPTDDSENVDPNCIINGIGPICDVQLPMKMEDSLMTEEDRRLSFCLTSDSHKDNFRSLKELWETSKTD